LLAGFSVATIGVVAANSHAFRWSGIALFALTASAILMVASLQFGFHARQHLYSAADIRDWWTAEELNEPRIAHLQREQKEDFRRWLNWSTKSRVAYNTGIVTLALGVAATLVPEPGKGVQESLRWAAVGLATSGAIGELIWIYGSRTKRFWHHFFHHDS
jgi:hypothetical protein